MDRPIILASASPRRRELLSQAGVPFTVDAADVDETFEGGPEETVAVLSARKARAVYEKHAGETVLAADTVVCRRDCILGKPRTQEEACRMLKMLSGGWHEVYTGVTVIREGSESTETARTRVHFMELTEEMIRRYAETGEPMDKAGAYAIQGGAARFIDRIEGSPSNVIGLPVDVACRMLGC